MFFIFIFKFLSFNWNDGQEGAEEEDVDNLNNDDDVAGDPVEAEENEEQEGVERTRKTSKYMTKYERARILGTRALQIRYLKFPNFTLSVYNFYFV